MGFKPFKKHSNSGIKIAKRVDATGLYCPAPIAILKVGLEEIKNSEIIEIIADDPKFGDDLKRWCSLTGNELLDLIKDRKGFYFGYIKKKNKTG